MFSTGVPPWRASGRRRPEKKSGSACSRYLVGLAALDVRDSRVHIRMHAHAVVHRASTGSDTFTRQVVAGYRAVRRQWIGGQCTGDHALVRARIREYETAAKAAESR